MPGAKDRRGPGISFIHGVKVRKSAVQNIANATDVALTWDVEDWDTADVTESKYHSNAENTTRLTAPRDGKYTLRISLDFATNGTGDRIVGYKINGGATQVINKIVATASDIVAGFVDIQLKENDYIEIVANQTVSPAAALDVEATALTSASLQWNGF